MEPFLTIRPLCGFAAADPTVPRRLSDFLARKRHAHRPFSLRPLPPSTLARQCSDDGSLNASQMEGFRGRLSHWKIHWNALTGRIYLWRARAGSNEPSSLVGSAANYVVLFGSNAMRRTQEVARKRGKGKLNLDRRVSFYVCKVRYPCCLRKKCLYLVRSACQNLSIFDPFNETERFEVETRWKQSMDGDVTSMVSNSILEKVSSV